MAALTPPARDSGTPHGRAGHAGRRRKASGRTCRTTHERGYTKMANDYNHDEGATAVACLRAVTEALDGARATIKGATAMADYVAERIQVAEGMTATGRERVCNAVDRAAFELGELSNAAECAAKWVRHACDALDAEGVA